MVQEAINVLSCINVNRNKPTWCSPHFEFLENCNFRLKAQIVDGFRETHWIVQAFLPLWFFEIPESVVYMWTCLSCSMFVLAGIHARIMQSLGVEQLRFFVGKMFLLHVCIRFHGVVIAKLNFQKGTVHAIRRHRKHNVTVWKVGMTKVDMSKE